MSARPQSERSDWTDLDLLTREEAAGRLTEYRAETTARLDQLGESDQGEREFLEARLRAIQVSLEDLARL